MQLRTLLESWFVNLSLSEHIESPRELDPGDTLGSHVFLLRSVAALHLERQVVSVLTIIQCTGLLGFGRLCLTFDPFFVSAFVSITSQNSRSLIAVASGLHS
jgi:hypothetical protein